MFLFLVFFWYGSNRYNDRIGAPTRTDFFVFLRQIPGTAFCAFFFFEQFLPVGVYMADARSQSLEYVTVGDPELAEHDWTWMFSRLGLLEHDVQIGTAVRVLGWIGMLAVVGWLIWHAWRWRPPSSD